MLYLAARDPRVPWYTKILLLAIVAYAVSPVDIVPDFIPVLGYIDDLIILPVGIYFALKLIPREVKEECRQKAKADLRDLKLRWIGLGLVILIWILILVLFVNLIW